MKEKDPSPFQIKIYHSAAEFGEFAWDELSRGQPFQSARWYHYGETVMEGCQPVYLVVFQEDRPIARATFWVVREEPLPVPPSLDRRLKPIFRRWPLLICRSPLSNSTGLIMPPPPLREPVMRLLAKEARRQAHHHHCSLILFDFLPKEEAGAPGWPQDFIQTSGGEPGTIMNVEWPSFEAYVGSRDSRNRRRVAYNKRKIEEAGLVVKRQDLPSNMDESLRLVERVEAKYGSPHNPWTRRMLEHSHLVESTFLEARQGRELVGCELILYDNGAQLPTALGHAGEASYDYLEMLYTNLCDAMEKHASLLRWGSGSYDIKRHLGFELEQNNHVRVGGVGWLMRLLIRLAALFVGKPRQP